MRPLCGCLLLLLIDDVQVGTGGWFLMCSVMVLKVWVGGCLRSEARCRPLLGCGIVRVIFELETRWTPNVEIN
jgi:hypothetical protein